jgi:hypothetical protein
MIPGPAWMSLGPPKLCLGRAEVVLGHFKRPGRQQFVLGPLVLATNHIWKIAIPNARLRRTTSGRRLPKIVVQHHQDELQSVLLVDDITIEKAAEEKQGKNASPEHYTSLQMRQRHRGRGMPFEP